MKDENVHRTYAKWINGVTLFEHILDRERFYRFVKWCVIYVKHIRFVKREEAWKSIDTGILTAHLHDDLAKLRENNPSAYDETIHEILTKFETLLEYEKTNTFEMGYKL